MDLIRLLESEFKLIVVLFLPPLAVYLTDGIGRTLFINIGLTFLCFWIPGCIHAAWIVYFKPKPEAEPTAEALTEILPGQTGRVMYQGTSWLAKSADASIIHPHQHLHVVSKKGTTLIVTPDMRTRS